MTPNTILVIGMVGGIAQQALILFMMIRNLAERLDLAANRKTVKNLALENTNATCM